MENFYDVTLIKLRRKYGKDETVNALSKKLTESNVEIGKLKSEIDELQYIITVLKNQIVDENKDINKEINKISRVEIKKDELFKQKHKECETLRLLNKKLVQQRDSLIAKNYSLMNEYEILQNGKKI